MGVPEKLGKYNIKRELGRGTTGIVYLCDDPSRNDEIALKLYTRDDKLTKKQRDVRRRLFFNEAHLVGLLHHPNILPFRDAGEEDGQCYVVMDYIAGSEPLTNFCKPVNLLPVRKVVEIIFKCARALEYAHRKGIVHRDLKPGNILLTDEGDVRILDFGVALTPLSDFGNIKGLIGSPSYMAPEQLRDEPASESSDVYSLGVLMYELLTGKRPYYGENLSKLIHQVIYATPPPIHRLRNEVPPELEAVVNRAIHKKKEKRYQTALEFSAALTSTVTQLGKLDKKIADQERFNLVRNLNFFKEFSYPEILEVLNAGQWRQFKKNQTMLLEDGALDDAFFVVISGGIRVAYEGQKSTVLRADDCFGETGFLDKTQPGGAGITAVEKACILQISTTLMEQASEPCQLKFYKVFLHLLLERLARKS